MMDDKTLKEMEERANKARDFIFAYYGSTERKVSFFTTRAIIRRMYADNQNLLADNKRLQAELDAAVEVIEQADYALKIMDEATDYVKPGTGIWHIIGITRELIRKWRGKGV